MFDEVDCGASNRKLIVAFDKDTTASRVRQSLAAYPGAVTEKRIVGGGLGFMVEGHLCCAVTSKGLTLRVGAEEKAELLRQPHTRPHMVGRRETAAFIVVEPEGFATQESFDSWLRKGPRLREPASPQIGRCGRLAGGVQNSYLPNTRSCIRAETAMRTNVPITKPASNRLQFVRISLPFQPTRGALPPPRLRSQRYRIGQKELVGFGSGAEFAVPPRGESRNPRGRRRGANA